MPWTRRQVLGAMIASAATSGPRPRKLDLIEAPNNLGLRPPKPGIEPGTWLGPAALDRAGLSKRLRPDRHERLVAEQAAPSDWRWQPGR